MKPEILQAKYEIITPCFCGGAEPEKQAEIRASSIRGLMRWWFRVLGGFRAEAYDGMNVVQQEDFLFGSASGGSGRAGALTIRIKQVLMSTECKDMAACGAGRLSDKSYLLWPLETRPNKPYAGKGVVNPGAVFELQILWTNPLVEKEGLDALATVLGELGSLGFRSRRGMGALKRKDSGLDLISAMKCFLAPDNVTIKVIPFRRDKDPLETLGAWLRSWRQHGRSQDLSRGNSQERPPKNPGFKYAKRDHDIGYDCAGNGAAYRPAIGLPIVQRLRKGTRHWTASKDGGRFASPVILRPRRMPDGKWNALVIFVDAKKWPENNHVYLDNQARDVSLDLYDAMKHDGRLMEFVG